MTAARTLRRKANTTRITSTTATRRVSSTSRNEAQCAVGGVVDDQGPILVSRAQLVVGIDLPHLVAVDQLSLRPPHVGAAEDAPDVFEADAVAAQRRRVELDAHRRQRATADEHLTDPFDLGQALLQDR